MLCRQKALSADVFLLEWIDGKSDIFTHVGDNLIRDSRGGLWMTDTHFTETGIYFSGYSVNSGMKIVWLVVPGNYSS